MSEAFTFPTIVADPDWRYANFGCAKHGAARAHYPGSTAETIASIPVGRWARKNSTLFLWATLPKLDQAVDVARAWGFPELVTGCPWVKTTPKAGEIKRGIGFWWQGTAELLLVFRRGRAPAPAQKDRAKMLGLLWGGLDGLSHLGRVSDPVFYAPRAAHSRKPLSLTEWIESRMPGPYLELYARVDRPGWTCWGHETGWHLSAEGVKQIKQEEAK